MADILSALRELRSLEEKRAHATMTPAEQAWYLQGAFFNTAVVQTSEGMAHLLLAIAQHPRVQDRVRREPGYLDAVIDETMRVWPLFGIAHRITTADIDVTPPIAAGSVVLFDYPGFQGGGDALEGLEGFHGAGTIANFRQK